MSGQTAATAITTFTITRNTTSTTTSKWRRKADDRNVVPAYPCDTGMPALRGDGLPSPSRHVSSAPKLKDQHRDIVRLRRPFGECGNRFLNGVVDHRAGLTRAHCNNLPQPLLAEEFRGCVLGLGYAIGIDHDL